MCWNKSKMFLLHRSLFSVLSFGSFTIQHMTYLCQAENNITVVTSWATDKMTILTILSEIDVIRMKIILFFPLFQVSFKQTAAAHCITLTCLTTKYFLWLRWTVTKVEKPVIFKQSQQFTFVSVVLIKFWWFRVSHSHLNELPDTYTVLLLSHDEKWLRPWRF